MIVYKIWTTSKKGRFYFKGTIYRKCERHWEGCFLFGILPLKMTNTATYYFHY